MDIINYSLECGQFPGKWKTASMRPLLKKVKTKSVASSYRPIRNLSLLSKLLEETVIDQFIQQCQRCALLQDYQLAYRKIIVVKQFYLTWIMTSVVYEKQGYT